MSSAPPAVGRDVLHEVKRFATTVREEVGRVVVGMDDVVDQLLIALVVGGHVLVEGVPGTAKTTIAKAFASVLGIEHHRVQFTPDLLPADITGTYVFDRSKNDFVLRKGPIFCQLLLADEINRAPAKTQAALLEAMQERQVTVEGTTLPLPQPFLVLATQNPVEQEGVYRLPEAQLDRFLLRVEMGYPPAETERDILRLHGRLGQSPVVESEESPGSRIDAADGAERKEPSFSVALPDAIFSAGQIIELQSHLWSVHVEPEVVHYIVELARASREHPDVGLGASPRASLYLMQSARARALLHGRHYCTHEDVQKMALSVLQHRLILRPEAEVEGRSLGGVLDDLFKKVPAIGDRTPGRADNRLKGRERRVSSSYE